MTFKTLRIALVVAAALPISELGAQVIQNREPRLLDQWTFGLSAFGGIPMGDFRQHENGGGGGELVVGFQPFRAQPLLLRGSVNSMLYGSQTAWGYQDVCDAISCWTERVQYNARNHTMTTLQGGAELMATGGTWRPFAFALGGVTWFNSWANLKADNPYDPDPGSESLFSSHNLSTTYGTGLRFVKSKFGRQTGFELSLRFNRNANARYLTERGVTRNPDGSYTVSPTTGAANVLGIHVGFWVGPYVGWCPSCR